MHRECASAVLLVDADSERQEVRYRLRLRGAQQSAKPQVCYAPPRSWLSAQADNVAVLDMDQPDARCAFVDLLTDRICVEPASLFFVPSPRNLRRLYDICAHQPS